MPKFDLKRFLSGFNLLSGEVRGKLGYYAIILCVGAGIFWAAFIRPTTKQVQNLKDCFKGAKIETVYVGENNKEENKWFWFAGTSIPIDKELQTKDVHITVGIGRKF